MNIRKGLFLAILVVFVSSCTCAPPGPQVPLPIEHVSVAAEYIPRDTDPSSGVRLLGYNERSEIVYAHTDRGELKMQSGGKYPIWVQCGSIITYTWKQNGKNRSSHLVVDCDSKTMIFK